MSADGGRQPKKIKYIFSYEDIKLLIILSTCKLQINKQRQWKYKQNNSGFVKQKQWQNIDIRQRSPKNRKNTLAQLEKAGFKTQSKQWEFPVETVGNSMVVSCIIQ